MKTPIEINSKTYLEDHTGYGTHTEYLLFDEGREIARTCGIYCLVNADGSANINDVRKWAQSFNIFHLAHTATFATIKQQEGRQ